MRRAKRGKPLLPRLELDSPKAVAPPFDSETLSAAEEIVERVRAGGAAALRSLAEQLDGLEPDGPLLYGADQLARSAEALQPADRRHGQTASGVYTQFGNRGPTQ